MTSRVRCGFNIVLCKCLTVYTYMEEILFIFLSANTIPTVSCKFAEYITDVSLLLGKNCLNLKRIRDMIFSQYAYLIV